MDAIQIELLEEYKYVDAICRDMLDAEKGVTAYIEQLDETPMTVRYWITEWNDEYRQLKHSRWLRNQIVHSTGSVECSQSDLDWLKGFHNRLLTQQDLLAKAHRVIQESQIQNQQQQAKNHFGGCSEAQCKRISFTERTSQIMVSDCSYSGVVDIDRNLDLDCKWWDKIKQAGRLSVSRLC